MRELASSAKYLDRSGPHSSTHRVTRLPVFALGMSLGLFLAFTFVLCVLFDLWFPALAMNSVWAPLLPGFAWIDWANFLLGMVEAFAYGWFIAVIFGPLYNYFSARFVEST